MSFEPFQKFVSRSANIRGMDKVMNAANICHQFRKLVPEIFKDKEDPNAHIDAASFKNETLVVNVKNQGWGQEVVMRKEKIIRELNDRLGKEVIKRLRTQVNQD